ncbi:MAG: hypothetical protein DRH90_25565 [Deltaproteobacteria bacterium]|nr:MAG: hypothetical protein DRH90_25565 [Deltaproteobacteria bacterium]
MHRILLSLVFVFSAGCGISRTSMNTIRITDGCTIEVIGISKEQMDEMISSWNVSPECTIVVRTERD